MKNIKGMTALVTGASSGIGFEFCRILADRGLGLVLAGRNVKKMTEMRNDLAGRCRIPVHVIRADLSTPGAGRKLYQECRKKKLKIDVLINNAGVGTFGLTTGLDPEAVAAMLQLNILSLTELCAWFVRDMKARKKGYVLNVGSLVGSFPAPWFTPYAASKAYVLNYSLGLREELRGSGVSVTCLEPGFVRTAFDAGAHITNKTYLKASHLMGMTARQVAVIGLKAMWAGRGRVVAGASNAMSAFVIGHLPKPFVSSLIGSGMKILMK